MSEVVLENAGKSYRNRQGSEVAALDDVSLKVRDREFMVLVGPSGCGKSTTLRLIAGLERPDRGRVLFDGRDITGVEPKHRDIAMVFQNYALYPHLRTFRNMEFGLSLRKMPRETIENRVHDAASVLGIAELLNRRPHQLSGGQRQRVALGRALVRQPRVFLFDEPLSNLDAKLRASMRTEISKLHARLAATMIYVTHDQVEAMTMGDRITVMKDGRILQVDEPLDLYHHPRTMFVASFIGSPPMNFLSGKIEERRGALFFVEDNTRDTRFMVSLSDRLTRLAQPYVGRVLVLGLRPEHILDAAAVPSAEPSRVVEANLEVVEPMGPESYVYFSTGAQSFIGRFDSSARYAVNQTLKVFINLDRAHLFDPETELALDAAPPR